MERDGRAIEAGRDALRALEEAVSAQEHRAQVCVLSPPRHATLSLNTERAPAVKSTDVATRPQRARSLCVILCGLTTSVPKRHFSLSSRSPDGSAESRPLLSTGPLEDLQVPDSARATTVRPPGPRAGSEAHSESSGGGAQPRARDGNGRRRRPRRRADLRRHRRDGRSGGGDRGGPAKAQGGPPRQGGARPAGKWLRPGAPSPLQTPSHRRSYARG